VTFIYSDAVDDVDVDAQLYVASEKFCVDGLRRRCLEILCDRINVSNAADFYCLAYLHEASRWNITPILNALHTRVQGPGSRVQGPGSRVQGLGCGVQGLGCGVQGPGSRVQHLGSRVWGLGSMVWGPGPGV
jgi:hypothetical protein